LSYFTTTVILVSDTVPIAAKFLDLMSIGVVKISKSLAHMETILSYVLEPYVVDNKAQNAPVDLFDDKGHLILAKGEKITDEVFALARTEQLFTLHLTGSSHTDIFREVNLISVASLIDACKAVNAVLTAIMADRPLYKAFKQLSLFDRSIYEHSMNVALLAHIIGKKMAIGPKGLHELTLGALLHDFGKLSIPLAILNKPGHLTNEEYEIMKSHPVLGREKLAGLNLPPDVLAGILSHHERWNGSGYPGAERAEKISLHSQIIAVADVFDAITADRPYRPGLPPYHALEMLVRGSGADFSPRVVEAFAALLTLYPENSWVTLNTGEVGTVTDVNREYPTRPTVQLLLDKYGQPVHGLVEIDLREDTERFVSAIKYREDTDETVDKAFTENQCQHAEGSSAICCACSGKLGKCSIC
jgi:putative nucleotidyltransferase with HDIG domain